MSGEPSKFISDAKAREDTAEHLDRVAGYADTAARFLSMGDDRGAEYAINKAANHLKHAVGCFADLKRRVMQQAKEEAYARQQEFRSRPIVNSGQRPLRPQQAQNGSGADESDEDNVPG